MLKVLYVILGFPSSLWLMNMYYNIIWLFYFITHQLILYYLILITYHSSTHSVLFDSHYLLLINSFCIIWSSLLFTMLHLSLFLFICSYLLSHISFWMADANVIYHSSLNIYYSSTLFVLFGDHYLHWSSQFVLFLVFPHIFHFWWLMLMPYIIPVLLFITHEHIITYQHIFFTICFCMDDANFTYHPSIIMYYSLINSFSYFFSHQHISPPPPHFGWLMLCSFSS